MILHVVNIYPDFLELHNWLSYLLDINNKQREELPTYDNKEDESQPDPPEADEEKPTVVVLRKGDLTEQEAQEIIKQTEGNLIKRLMLIVTRDDHI